MRGDGLAFAPGARLGRFRTPWRSCHGSKRSQRRPGQHRPHSRDFQHCQGCQFTSAEWTGRLIELDVRISMDGKGRWMDNVFIERLWRSVKYEEIYLREHATIPALEAGLTRWFHRYNGRGRDAGFPAPPAQIPASGTTAPGSYLEWWRHRSVLQDKGGRPSVVATSGWRGATFCSM